ncbi:MAG: hypothetical protein ABL986_06625 [Vicinamibacterales bacterium]
MKVLFSTLHFAGMRNFESVVRTLAERGHHVHVAAEEPETFGGQALVEGLASEYPTFTFGWAPLPDREPWYLFARKVRYALEYVRFLSPEFSSAEKLRLRNVGRVPRLVRWASALVPRSTLGARVLVQWLAWLERRIPVSSEVSSFLASHRPDILVLTSLTMARSTQIHQIKAARTLGMRTAVAVQSWDHLSSKALLHVAPEVTLVWNHVQKEEAVSLHGLPAERVIVTGAQCYDQWFDRCPVRDRQQFCQAMGLDPARRVVLYVCSAMSPVPNPVEPVFVRDWVFKLRASDDPDLREASVLIRPHPERAREWRDVSLDDCKHTVVSGRTPIDEDAKADFFDSLFYSDVVVGLCTSVFLEAAIVGRPVLTLLLPEFRMHQEGMAHFRYLLTVGGGLLHTAADVPTHLEQLGACLRLGAERDPRNRRFLEAFVRPEGLGVPSTGRFVAALETLAVRPAPQPDRWFVEQTSSALVVRWLAAKAQSEVGKWLMIDSVEVARKQLEHDRARVKDSKFAARQSRLKAKADRVDRAAREAELERESKHAVRVRARRAKQLAVQEHKGRKRRLRWWRSARSRAVEFCRGLSMKSIFRRFE